MSTIRTYLLSHEQRQKKAMVFAPGCHRFLYERDDRKPLENLVGWSNIREESVWMDEAVSARNQHPFVVRFTCYSAYAKETVERKVEELRAALGDEVEAQYIHKEGGTEFADFFVIFLKGNS